MFFTAFLSETNVLTDLFLMESGTDFFPDAAGGGKEETKFTKCRPEIISFLTIIVDGIYRKIYNHLRNLL